MTVTGQIKILDRKIMQNEAQYDLDRKTTKISALSSNNLDKYEYLTGEDLGLKPSIVEQAKFEYSPLGKVFTKGLDKDDQKEGLFKRLKYIEDKNEEQLELFSKANKTSRLAKNESEYNCDNNRFAFCKFYRGFQNFKNISLKSKYDDISKFYMALEEFKKHKVITDETKKYKTRVMKNVVTLYNNYFDFYEKNYDESDLKGRSLNQFKIADNKLPKWLESKNCFNEATRSINNITINTNKNEVSKKDKNAFNDLDKWIIDRKHYKIEEKDAVERLEKNMSDLTKLGKKKKLFFKIR